MFSLNLKATKAGRLVQEIGLTASCFYLLDRVGERLFPPLRARSYRIVAQPVPARARLPEHRAKAFSSRELTAGDPLLAALPVSRVTRAFRFDQGARCLGLFHGGDLVGYIWLRLGDYLEDEVRVRFVPEPQGEVCWDFDAFLFPDFRKGFAFAALWDAADAFLRAQGISHTLSRIAATNVASLRSHARLGAVDLGGLSVVRIGSLQVCFANLPRGPRLSLTLTGRPSFICRVPSAGGARGGLAAGR